MRAIAQHHWGKNSSLDLDNGTRIEKRGDMAFYIVDPGAPNQKVFTILYSPSLAVHIPSVIEHSFVAILYK